MYLNVSVEDGWYIKSVLVNGKKTRLSNNGISIDNVSEDVSVFVLFEEDPVHWWSTVDKTMVIII